MPAPIIGWYSILSAAAVVAASEAHGWTARGFAAWAALAFAQVVAAYTLQRPAVFGKRANGTVAWWAWVLHGPYFALSHLGLLLYRFLASEKPCHEITPGLFLGCRLGWLDRSTLTRLEVTHLLDLTCEFSEAAALRAGREYCCLPLLDHGAPDAAGMEAATAFLNRALQTGRVYVHCAVGHGRSATVVAAHLLGSGQAHTAAEAVRCLQAIRPGVRLNSAQQAALKHWEERLRMSAPG